MRPTRTLTLRREALAPLDVDDLRRAAGQAMDTPFCTTPFESIPLRQCLSGMLVACPTS